MSKLVGKFIVDQDRIYVIEELLPDGRVFIGKYQIELLDDYAGVRYEGNVVLPIPDDRPGTRWLCGQNAVRKMIRLWTLRLS